jgi:hypothetical protein
MPNRWLTIQKIFIAIVNRTSIKIKHCWLEVYYTCRTEVIGQTEGTTSSLAGKSTAVKGNTTN